MQGYILLVEKCNYHADLLPFAMLVDNLFVNDVIAPYLSQAIAHFL